MRVSLLSWSMSPQVRQRVSGAWSVSWCRGFHERLGLLALLCYFAVGFITLSALVLVKYIIKWWVLWLLAFLNLVGIDSFDNKRARIAVEGRWPWRTTDVYAGSASQCTEAVQNDAARGCQEGHRGSICTAPPVLVALRLTRCPLIFPLTRWTSPAGRAWLEEPCVVRGVIPKELVDGLADELQVKKAPCPENR